MDSAAFFFCSCLFGVPHVLLCALCVLRAILATTRLTRYPYEVVVLEVQGRDVSFRAGVYVCVCGWFFRGCRANAYVWVRYIVVRQGAHRGEKHSSVVVKYFFLGARQYRAQLTAVLPFKWGRKLVRLLMLCFRRTMHCRGAAFPLCCVGRNCCEPDVFL